MFRSSSASGDTSRDLLCITLIRTESTPRFQFAASFVSLSSSLQHDFFFPSRPGPLLRTRSRTACSRW